MTMKTIISALLLSLILVSAKAQEQNAGMLSGDALARIQQMELEGKIYLYLDSLIAENYNKHLVQNKKIGGIDGYRIRIFSDNGMGAKDSQKRVRARFLSLFPEIPTYNRYEGSYYKIYVGDFRTKRDALKVMEMISKRFQDAFIVEYHILIDE